MWSFAISQHGLALSYDDLRAMTPRAYSALKRRWREHRDFHLTIHASLQATLHNAWLRGEGAPAFKPDDFMPGKKKGQSVEDNIAMLAAAMEAATAQMGQRPRHEVQVDDDGRRRWEELRQQALARKAAASGG